MYSDYIKQPPGPDSMHTTLVDSAPLHVSDSSSLRRSPYLAPILRDRKKGAVTQDKTVIFDGDDTLWAIQPLFDKAKALFADQAYEKLKTERTTALAAIDRIDLVNVSKMGFSPLRFPSSLVETFEYLCTAKSVVPSELEKQQIYALGTAVYETTPPLLEGARDVLRVLGESFRLILYTMGDAKVQRSLINKLDLGPYFPDSIYIVPQKNRDQLQVILKDNHLAPRDVWMVGNSLRSDINPALQLDVKCIWVNIYSWAYDQSKKIPSGVMEVRSLRDILQFIR